MKVLILGAGRMSHGLVSDFLKNETGSKITIADINPATLQEIQSKFKSDRISVKEAEADNIFQLKPLFEEADGVISAVPYDYNPQLTKLAVENGCHFVDLGGNNTVVERQFRLHDEAKNAGVSIIPDCGLAPGMASVLAAYAMDQLARVDDVKIRVGGLPVDPKTPLKYKLVFSPHGLINEYIEQAVILEDGRITKRPSMTGLETLDFPSPFGHLEAFYTSGGTSTLPLTFEGQVTNLDYKTIRYPGHCSLMKSMIDLGFTDKEKRFNYEGKEYDTRAVFEAMLSSLLDYPSDDVVLIRVSAKGQKEGKEATIAYQAIEYGDKELGLTAMMRTTAFPAAVVMQLILNSVISERGVLRQEKAIPGFRFISEIEKRGIFINPLD